MGRPARRRPPLSGDPLDLHAAYVLGNAVKIRARRGEEEPRWAEDLDPLETLFLGAAWPEHYGDAYRFANACATWLRVLRGTPYWAGIDRFAREALAVSREHDLVVRADEMYVPLRERLEAARPDLRALPPDLLPEEILRGTRCFHGPARDIRLPEPPLDAEDLIRQFWAARGSTELSPRAAAGHGVTALGGLTTGLHRLRAEGALGVLSHQGYGSVGLLKGLYTGLVLQPGEELPGDLINRAIAWALGLPAESPLVPVTDVLIIGTERGLETGEALGHLFGVPEFRMPVSEADREWRSSTGTALWRMARALS